MPYGLFRNQQPQQRRPGTAFVNIWHGIGPRPRAGPTRRHATGASAPDRRLEAFISRTALAVSAKICTFADGLLPSPAPPRPQEACGMAATRLHNNISQ